MDNDKKSSVDKGLERMFTAAVLAPIEAKINLIKKYAARNKKLPEL